jgi:hypothetical protein
VKINKVNEENFHNLLSEFYLRPYPVKKLTEKEFESKLDGIINKIKTL